MRDKFFVLALPRSRTYWLSKFLQTPTCEVAHEGSCEYSSVDEMLEKMPDGICDTALALHWKLLPGKVVIIDRGLDECVRSAIGRGMSTRFFGQLKRELNEASKVHPVFKYEDLRHEHICKWLFEYLTEEKFDRDRWIAMDNANLQSEWTNQVKKYEGLIEKIKLMYGGVKWDSLVQ